MPITYDLLLIINVQSAAPLVDKFDLIIQKSAHVNFYYTNSMGCLYATYLQQK